jgi:hypothetical protein
LKISMSLFSSRICCWRLVCLCFSSDRVDMFWYMRRKPLKI